MFDSIFKYSKSSIGIGGALGYHGYRTTLVPGPKCRTPKYIYTGGPGNTPARVLLQLRSGNNTGGPIILTSNTGPGIMFHGGSFMPSKNN